MQNWNFPVQSSDQHSIYRSHSILFLTQFNGIMFQEIDMVQGRFVVKSELKIAVHKNSWFANKLIEDGDADVVILIFGFNPGDTKYTWIMCKDEQTCKRMQDLLPRAFLLHRDQKQKTYILCLNGPGEFYRDQVINNLPQDDSWSFIDWREEYQIGS